MRLILLMMTLVHYLLSASAVSAITLTNHDASDQKIVVIEGDKQTERVVKPAEKIDVCPQSCVVRMPDNEEYEFDGTELVSIEDGLLLLDLPEEQAKSGH